MLHPIDNFLSVASFLQMYQPKNSTLTIQIRCICLSIIYFDVCYSRIVRITSEYQLSTKPSHLSRRCDGFSLKEDRKEFWPIQLNLHVRRPSWSNKHWLAHIWAPLASSSSQVNSIISAACFRFNRGSDPEATFLEYEKVLVRHSKISFYDTRRILSFWVIVYVKKIFITFYNHYEPLKFLFHLSYWFQI